MPKIESYTKSTVYDQSQITILPPLDSGYNIVGAIFTPNGPIEKMKITSATEFAKYYLDGTSITPSDNITCQYLFELLKSNPVYVMRAVPIIVLEGITSTGRSLLFNSEYEMIDEYYKFWIKGLKDKRLNYQLDILDDKHESVGSYYVGVGGEGQKLSDNKDLKDLVKYLPISAADNDDSNLLVCYDKKIVLFNRTAEVSSNVGVFNLTTDFQKYSIINSTDVITENIDKNGKVARDSYISCNNTNYVFNTNDSSKYVNLVNIYDPLNKSTIEPIYMLMQVISKANLKTSNKLRFKIKDSDSSTTSMIFSNIRSIVEDEYGYFNVLINDDKVEKDGYIVVTYNGQTNVYYTGKQPEYLENIDNYFRISLDQVSTYYFITKTIEFILINNVSKFKDPALRYFYFDNYDSDSSEYQSSINVYMDYNTVNSNIFLYQDNKETDFVSTYDIEVNDNEKYIKYTDFHIRVGNYIYYVGESPDSTDDFPLNSVFIQLSNKKINFNEFYALLMEALITTQSITGINNSLISFNDVAITKGSIHDDVDIEINGRLVDGNYYPIKVTQSKSNDQFAVIQKFPVNGDYFQYKYSKNTDNNKLLDFSWNYKNGAEVGESQISFYSGVVDSYGLDAFYTKIDNPFIQIVNLKDDGDIGDVLDIFESSKFGSNVLVPQYNINYLSDTIKTIVDYDDGIKYDCITDMGVANTGYAKTIENIANNLHTIYPASLPTAKNDDVLKNYVNSCGFSSYQVILLAPADRVPINEYSVLLPSSIKDIQSMINMYNNVANEFAPRFGEQQGVVSSNNLVKKYKIPARNDLLKYNIRTLAASTDGTSYYINDNLTCNITESYLSEEQIVRSVNKAVHVMELFIKQYDAKYNVKATRDNVQDQANALLNEILFKGKNFTPVMYRAVCNELNNPITVIDNNQLVVSLYASFTRAIKYKLINHYIIPLSQASQMV